MCEGGLGLGVEVGVCFFVVEGKRGVVGVGRLGGDFYFFFFFFS